MKPLTPNYEVAGPTLRAPGVDNHIAFPSTVDNQPFC